MILMKSKKQSPKPLSGDALFLSTDWLTNLIKFSTLNINILKCYPIVIPQENLYLDLTP